MTGKRSTIYSAAPNKPTVTPKPYVHDRPARLINEWQACHTEKARLAIRGNIGKDWDGKAANDNIAWPLAKALLAEGNKELLKYAIAYRRIYTLAKSEAVLGGSAVSMSDKELSYDRYVYDNNVPDGHSVYKQVRQSKASSVDMPAENKVPVREEDLQINSVKVPKPWNGDKPVNDMIDAKRQLVILQAAVGSILDPFEMMVVDGSTLKEAGHAAGASNRDGAMGAGRAVAHMGLIAVRDRLGKLERKDLAA